MLNCSTLPLRLSLCTLALCSMGALAQSAPTPDALPDAPSTTAHEAAPAQPTGPTVVFDTTMGRLTCKLFSKEAPITTASFVGLATGSKTWIDPTTQKQMVDKPFYDGTTFHHCDSMCRDGWRWRTPGLGRMGASFLLRRMPSQS
jgi:peptidyl-prolyl cis-trans isomerase A (cyclophilin A)